MKKPNLRFKRPYQHEKLEAGKFIIRSLDGNGYERGQMETMEAQSNNVTEALARLVQILSDEDVITDEQVYHIAGQS